MASWRDEILREFTPNVSRLTLAADPDALLLEEGVLEGIRARGFELVPFEDRVAFRYAYESRFRSRWDRGERTDLVVVLHSPMGDLGELPYDLLQAGRRLAFSLGDIFPNLSYPVVAELDRAELDALYAAQTRYTPGQLGDNATKDFVLRHVFEIAPESIRQPSDLLRALLRRHYRRQRIPAALDDRLVSVLRKDRAFDDWPLERLVGDPDAFFAFLQERWAVFLDREAAKERGGVREDAGGYGLRMQGPADLPFDHDDIRVYIDNLFAEGLLEPVSHPGAEALTRSWAGIGVRTDPLADRIRRLRKLLDRVESSLPGEDARYVEWFTFARGWAQLAVLLNEPPVFEEEAVVARALALQGRVDDRFLAWVSRRFAGLANLPPAPPVMLHHIPRFLARELGGARDIRAALVVMDGLAMDQWLIVRNALVARRPEFRFREEAVFAWVPSLTSVSRQAAFAGRAPVYFPDALGGTAREPALWKQFWVDHGLEPRQVFYAKGLGDGDMGPLSEAIAQPYVRVAGLVVDTADRIMHGMELGAAGMHNQVRQWAEQPYLERLLSMLLDCGYRVYITSDHGNIEARGCGAPQEGAVADVRGERARVYPDKTLRSRVKSRFPDAVEWDSPGLPDDYCALLAPHRRAFIQEDRRTVSHGGVSLEELVVPLVQLEARSRG